MVDRLYYHYTVGILFGCCLIVTGRQCFGDPIDCIESLGTPKDVLETFCWITSTYTVPSACTKTIGVEVPHPCLDISSSENDKRYHAYYQWVPFILFLMAVVMYLPV